MDGKPEEARKTMGRALAAIGVDVKAAPDPKPRPLPSSAAEMVKIAEIMAMAGDASGALKSLGTFDDGSSRRRALEQVVAARAAAGDVKGALELATRWATPRPPRRGRASALEEGRGSRCRDPPATGVAGQGDRMIF